MSPDPTGPDRKPWWKGARGEWLVAVQVLLMALVFLGPRTTGGPAWPYPLAQVCSVLGSLLMIAGGILLVAALVYMRRGLTPLPYPKDGAPLVQTGPFGLVRHPMYTGGLILALGWAFRVQGWLTLGYVLALFVFLDVKSRREERWLSERFPAYAAYRWRVRKLIPFLY